MRNFTDLPTCEKRHFYPGIVSMLCTFIMVFMLHGQANAQAAISAAKTVLSVEDAASGTPNNVDVTYQIVVKNTGDMPLNNIGLTDDLSNASNIGTAHVGITATGAPAITASTNMATPTLDASYTGEAANANIFTGTDGALNAGDSLIVVFTAEVNPEMAADATMLFNQATATASVLESSDTVMDLTDDGAITATNTDMPTQVLPCSSNCEINAIGQIHVSVDPMTCEATILASMASNEIQAYCASYYTVTVFDLNNNELPNATVNATHIGQNLTFRITEPECGNVSWGLALVEDYVAPEIVCADVTISCAGVGNIPDPTVTDLCQNSTFILMDEVHETLECDPDHIGTITRTYIAEDSSGNQSDPCVQTIYLERIGVGSVIPPANRLFPNNHLVCGSNYQKDENGNPHVNVTGVPTNAAGDNLYPIDNSVYCNSYSDYEDQIISIDGCVTKIMRTFTIGEWHCNTTNTMPRIQMIDIVDTTPPSLTAPSDMTVSTATFSCSASVALPAATVSDECNEPIAVDIQYPDGFLDNQNGGLVVLPVGEHTITYTAYDNCENSSSSTMKVTVVDQSDPIAICDQHDVVGIGIDGYGAITATALDDGSFDECGDVSLAIAIMGEPGFDDGSAFRETIEFDCSHIGQTIMIALKVTDLGGNSNMCMVSVDIQDKVHAFINCPDNELIECGTPYDLNDLSQFGVPTITDNCDNTTFTETVVEDVNECGQGTITRTFTINDAVGRSCTQVISVVNYANALTENDIVWPGNYTSNTACTEVNHTPEYLQGIDPDFGFPVIDDNTTCRLTGMDYTDEEFIGGGGACRTIYRKWVVIDWCAEPGIAGYPRFTHTQVITLNNTIDPTITSSTEPIALESYASDCGTIPVTDLVVTATDDCTPAANLLYSYDVDFDADGIYEQMNVPGADASGVYPLGTHNVRFTVRDGCGNEAYSERQVSIINLKTPTPYCYDTLYVDLTPMDLDNDGTPDAEMAVLPVSTFDAGTYHSCGYDFTLSFSADVNDTELTVDCSDVGFIDVQLWATDENGNADFCITKLGVQDNNNVDICGQAPMVAVSGLIYTENLQQVANAQVGLMQQEGIYEMTDEEGNYAFDEIMGGQDYQVVPYKNDGLTNGVSTLDVVLIQRHIIGIAPLETPFQMIAADVNNSNSISASDVVALRKVVLGVQSELPNKNTSWRFVDAGHEFVNYENPWHGNIAEDYSIFNINEDMSIDFVAVKVGDVNGSVELNAQSTETEVRSAATFDMQLMDREVKVGEMIELEVIANQNTNLLGWQKTWSLEHLNYVGVVPAKCQITDRNVSLDGQKLHMSYTQPQGVEFEAGELMYIITLQATKAAKLSELIQIDERALRAEAYTADLDIQDIAVRWDEQEVEALSAFELKGNDPNPWKEMTTVSFSIPEAGNVKINVKNVAGQSLYSRSSYREAGEQSVQITRDMIPVTGVLILEVHYQDEVKSHKMIIVD